MTRCAIEYCLSITPVLKEFCKPLEKYFGIKQFHYAKVYKNGHYFIVSNDSRLNQDIIKNISTCNIFFRDYLNTNISYDCIFWPHYPQNPLMEMHCNHGYWHGLTLILDKSDEFVELACFLGDKNNYTMTESYYKNIYFLEKFVNQFKKQFAEEIKISSTDNKKLAIFSCGVDLYIPDKQLLQDQQMIKAFYNAIGLTDMEFTNNFDNFVKLTSTERKVIKLASEGYTAKKIAKELGMAPKTAEAHIHNVKQKTGLHYKYDLIKMYNNFLIK